MKTIKNSNGGTIGRVNHISHIPCTLKHAVCTIPQINAYTPKKQNAIKNIFKVNCDLWRCFNSSKLFSGNRAAVICSSDISFFSISSTETWYNSDKANHADTETIGIDGAFKPLLGIPFEHQTTLWRIYCLLRKLKYRRFTEA